MNNVQTDIGRILILSNAGVNALQDTQNEEKTRNVQKKQEETKESKELHGLPIRLALLLR